MDKNLFAVNPPMGWNSWDCYGASVTEEDLIRNADSMAGNTLYAIFSGRSRPQILPPITPLLSSAWTNTAV